MIHIGKLIDEELRRQRRSVQWLADSLYLDRSNVYRLLRRPSIDTELLCRISRLLGRDFFDDYSREWHSLHDERQTTSDDA